MQIHEITRRRTDEGILAGIANHLAGTAINAVGGPNLVNAVGGMSIAPGQAQQVGSKIGDTLVEPTANAAATEWEKALAAWASQIGTTNPKDPKWQQLSGDKEEALDQLINKRLLRGRLRSYNDLPAYFKNDPTMTEPAEAAVRKIDAARTAILALPVGSDKKQDMLPEFRMLIQGTFSAQNLMQTKGSDTQTPQAAQMVSQIQQKLGVDAETASDLANGLKNIPTEKLGDFATLLNQLKATT